MITWLRCHLQISPEYASISGGDEADQNFSIMADSSLTQRCRSTLFASFSIHLTSCIYAAQTYMQHNLQLHYYPDTILYTVICKNLRISVWIWMYMRRFYRPSIPDSFPLLQCSHCVEQQVLNVIISFVYPMQYIAALDRIYNHLTCPVSEVRCPACGQDSLRDSYA